MFTVMPIEPPLSGTDAGGMQILIHWVWHNSTLWFGYVDVDGKIHSAPAEDLTVDFRFTKDGRWLSVGPADLARGEE